ncbi:hypothetical protein PAXRUDRAFT_804427 [Paxillus rubicundulus Ve08.2h10]|uniref:non-specific serine/threonine protein kinase n=1 Tax=Paxillus rubicundulus Ve08.2h10 TaxID=930991 RepID=A0A0D0DNS0_9AGAM|nr:hypothetical protein PAXRUDRAFT_804427 [Paxillus rubicundulus Ve08.2h10]
MSCTGNSMRLLDFSGQIIDHGHYFLICIIGFGTYGCIYHAVNTTSDPSHPQYYAAKYLYYAIIKSKLFHYNDSLIRQAFVEILNGVQACHRRGVFHHDLKIENILCRKDSTDIWSLGLILVDMVAGHPPWQLPIPLDKDFFAFLQNENHFHETFGISQSLNNLLNHVLNPDPLAQVGIPEFRKEILEMDTFFKHFEGYQVAPRSHDQRVPRGIPATHHTTKLTLVNPHPYMAIQSTSQHSGNLSNLPKLHVMASTLKSVTTQEGSLLAMTAVALVLIAKDQPHRNLSLMFWLFATSGTYLKRRSLERSLLHMIWHYQES